MRLDCGSMELVAQAVLPGSRNSGSATKSSSIAKSLLSLPESSARVAERYHVAILHDVLFAFEAHLRLFTRRAEAARGHQVFPVHHFGLDEPALDVAVNCARCFLRVHAALDRPRAAFRLACREKRNQPEQLVA